MALSSYQRVMAAMDLKEPDRVPIVPMAKLFCVKYGGRKVNECFEQPEKYVGAQMKMLRDFEFDAAYDLYSGVPLFNEFLGGKLNIEETAQPSAAPVVKSIDDLKKVEQMDLRNYKRMEDVCRLLRRLKEEVRGDYPVIAMVHYPFRSAALLRGVQEFFLDLALNPSFVRALLDFCAGLCRTYAEMIIETGPDIIFTSQAVASRDCISRKHYEQFVTAQEKEFNLFLRSKKKKILHHTCGDWDDRFDLVMAEAPDVIYVSAKANLGQLKEKYGKKICLMGNLHCVDVMARGTPDQVKSEALKCIQQAGSGGGYILSGDCDLAYDTPVESMRAMADAGKTFGGYPLKL